MTFRDFLIGLLNRDIKQGYCKGSFREEPFLISEEMLFSDINGEHNVNEDTCVNIVWNSIFHTGMIRSGTCGSIEDAKELLNTDVTVFTPNTLEPDTSFKNIIYDYLRKAKEITILEEGSVIRTFKAESISGTKVSNEVINTFSFYLGMDSSCFIDMDRIISVYLKQFLGGSVLYISMKGRKHEKESF